MSNFKKLGGIVLIIVLAMSFAYMYEPSWFQPLSKEPPDLKMYGWIRVFIHTKLFDGTLFVEAGVLHNGSYEARDWSEGVGFYDPLEEVYEFPFIPSVPMGSDLYFRFFLYPTNDVQDRKYIRTMMYGSLITPEWYQQKTIFSTGEWYLFPEPMLYHWNTEKASYGSSAFSQNARSCTFGPIDIHISYDGERFDLLSQDILVYNLRFE